ncbi:OpgC family protein [Bradyrhizobium sp. STM 3562]|uniref:OpgC family protein n=1 Tax=Bradyrhizobium sp. STM 3562 TaxID=578924 RepID=UPI0038903BDF
MQPTIKASLAAHGRDLRIDFARGIANWFMLIDHIPHDVVGLFTMRNFGFSGAVDLFVFVSGYAVAILYGKMTLERGFIVAASRIIKRAWQLYAAHIVLFVIYINAIGWAAERYAAPDIIEEYRVIGILNDPVRVLTHGLLLQSRPLNLDVLQMAIVLLLFFPVALAGLLRWPNLTMLGSIVLYFVSRQFGWGLPAFPAGSPYLNPFCWQLLFVLGAWFALSGGKFVRTLQELWPLRVLALAYLVFSLLIMVAAESPAIGSMLPDILSKAFIPIDRENLGLARVLHILSIALLFTWLVPADWKGFHSRLMQPIIKCGEEWLACFCAGVFLSLAGYIVLITSPNSYLLQVLVSATALVLMTAVAYYVSWSRQQDRGARLGPARAKDDHAIADR